MTFIDKVVRDLFQERKTDFSSTVVVFPNRRAGLFFKNALSQYVDQPIWAPSILSIREFVGKVSPLQTPGQLTLLMELYQTYKELGIDEAFDTFYPWGQMLLNDFDEIDKYLVDGGEVFLNLAEIKSFEERFSLDEGQLEALKQFWTSFSEDSKSNIQSEFLNIWDTNRQVYGAFRERLRSKGWGYEGMIYRDLAENPGSGDYQGWEQIVFAGFNALSPAETSILKYWSDQGIATIYWDADEYYLNDPLQEAGKFLRYQFNHHFQQPGSAWIENRLKSEDKNIKVFGVPLNVGQAKALGNILKKKHGEFQPENTAIVLPDENMLFPVLNAIPEEYKEINVTMGYPLRNTPFFSLFESLIKMQQEAGGGSKEKKYYFREVLNILMHPYVYSLAPKAIEARKETILKNNEIFVPASVLQHLGKENKPAFEQLFQSVEKVEGVFPYFRQVLFIVQEELKNTNDQPNRVEQEYLYHFYTYLKKLEEVMSDYDVDLALDTFWRLFRQVTMNQSLPFTGEPLRGLQVMGMLETRNLDFENVFVLSANEGQMPPSGGSSTFMPFNIRKAFGLPTYEEEDALFSYHFYRLMQRAKNVYLFYDTEMSSLDKGEKSRYIYQAENEWKLANPNLKWQEYTLNAPLVDHPENTIEIQKQGEVWEKLTKYFSGSKDESEQSGLSPSALITYIDCPLQFYFRYVAGIQEEEEVTEDIQPDVLGSIFHHAIARLYEIHQNRFGNEVSQESLKQLEEEVEGALNEGLQEHFSKDLNNIQGRNLLIKSILNKQVQSVLDRDKEQVPFNLLSVEKDQYSAQFPVEVNDEKKYVKLKGIIDRMDEKDGVKRVIDYKTGQIHYRKSQGVYDFFKNSNNKTALQLLWYGYVYKKNFPEDFIKLGAYPLKQVKQPINFLFNGKVIDDETFQNFEEGLAEELENLFNPEVPFRQTEDLKTCHKCPYNVICHRKE